jgi:sporulation protein YqfC
MFKKSNIKSSISDSLELPKEVILNIPVLKVVGKNDVYIENHKGIVEYSSEILRINSEIGIIKIVGKNLYIKEINREELFIFGDINMIEFII